MMLKQSKYSVLRIRIVIVIWAVGVALLAGAFTSTKTAFAQEDSPVVGVFEGITPCTNINRPVLLIPEDAACEMMIWHLTLEQDPATGEPTTYKLESTYGMSQPNTTGIQGGGTPINLEGSWTIMTGTKTDLDATVYQLDTGDPQMAIAFVRMDDYLLHVLMPDMSLAVGNGGWSYTINRADQRPEADAEVVLPDAPAGAALPPTTGNGSEILGVFDGRTPCGELMNRFTMAEPEPDCIKIKWRLFLYHDPETGTPTTYLFDGVETSREGSWTRTLGTQADPNGIVYQLRLEDTGEVFSLLRADEHHLFMLDEDLRLMVGDALWSYTLSWVEGKSPRLRS